MLIKLYPAAVRIVSIIANVAFGLSLWSRPGYDFLIPYDMFCRSPNGGEVTLYLHNMEAIEKKDWLQSLCRRSLYYRGDQADGAVVL